MSNDITIEEIESRYREFRMDKPPDRDHTQAVLTGKFIRFLNTRHDTPVKDIVETFYYNWHGQLDWLGEQRQDAMLREAMQQTGVDLSEWIESEG